MSESSESSRKRRRELFAVHLGDFVEESIGRAVQERLEVPALEAGGEPRGDGWYRDPIPEGITADGSPYHIYVRRGSAEKLCLLFSGGGIAWNEYTASRPVTGGAVAAWQPNFYWDNLRPFTQVYNINVGLTALSHAGNAFADWSFVVITYATGDMHLGRADFPYTDQEGRERICHFRGYDNFRLAMAEAVRLFPAPEQLLIAGESAGAFAVPALSEEIADDFYPHCKKITLLSDSGQLLYKKWRVTARDIWNAPQRIWQDIRTVNVTLDWYRALYARQGERFSYLYASSVHDYLLSAFYNDVTRHEYATDERVQEIYRKQLRHMVSELHKLTPSFHFFLNTWKRPVQTAGGTIHTLIRQPEFYFRTRSGISMAQWLADAVGGRGYNVGLDALGGKLRGTDSDTPPRRYVDLPGQAGSADISRLRLTLERGQRRERELHPRGAAVLLPLLPRPDGSYDVLFEVRAQSLRTQPGEVSFPGGALESGERPAAAAVRECCEELCVRPEQVQLFGDLGQLQGPGSSPFYALCAVLTDYQGTFSADEVERTFTVPLSYFLEHEPQVFSIDYPAQAPQDFPWERIPGGRAYPLRGRRGEIPFYTGTDPLIWGATARVIQCFSRLWREGLEELGERENGKGEE